MRASIPTIEELRLEANRPAAEAEAMHRLGVALLRRSELESAVDWLSRAASAGKNIAEYHLRAGAALLWTARFAEAEEHLEYCLRLDPDQSEAARHLAWVCINAASRPARGVELLAWVIARDPDQIDDYIGLCRNWLRSGATSIPSTAAVAPLLPANGRRDYLQRGLAIALMNVGRYEEALEVFRGMPAEWDAPELTIDRAQAELAVNGLDAARQVFERGLRDYPHSPMLVVAYLQFLVRADDIPKARSLYCSPQGQRLLHGRRHDAPLGTDWLAGKRILLRAVGGFGDTIQWAGFAPLLSDVGCRVIVECAPALSTLLAGVPGVTKVVAPSDPVPPFDEACRADVPPFVLEWSWPDLAARAPYVKAPRAAPRWADAIRSGPGLRVGLCWQSGYNRDSYQDPYAHRSIPPQLVEERLLSIPGVTFYKIGRSDADLDGVEPVSRAFSDFSDTAAAIDAVDLVVTVDTSVAHLAGAMGKPSLLMLPYVACWRWRHETSECGWYPSVQIFRQSRPGSWDDVITTVAGELGARVASRR